MASTLTLRLNDEADEVEEMLVNPWARWNEARRGGERVGRRQSNGGRLRSLAAHGERRGMRNGKGECVRAGARWLQDAAATPECARRVASALRRAATGGGHAASFF